MALSLRDLTVAQLKKATAIKERMEQLERELTGILGIPEPMTIGGMVRRKKKMSAAGRKAVGDAVRARWARINGAKITTAPAKAKGTMPAATRAKLSAAAKARWAKIRSGKK